MHHARTPKKKTTASAGNTSINQANNSPISGLPSALDSAVRGVGRFIETKISSQLNRILFRFASEVLRFCSSRTLESHLKKEPMKENLLQTSITKALEITIGSALIDPNRETNYLKRCGKGLLNMIARLGARFAMTSLNWIKKEQLNLKTILDEFASRTICRLLCLNSKNPMLGILTRSIEQFAINEWLRFLPISNQFLKGPNISCP